MDVGKYAGQLRSEALHCPVRHLCPFAFLCGEHLGGEKYLLPAIGEVGSDEMIWTDLGARRQVYVVRSGILVSKSFANGGCEIPTGLFSAGFVAGLPDIFNPYVASDFYFFMPIVPGQLCCFDGNLVKERIEALGADAALALLTRISLNQTTGMYGQALTLSHQRVREKVASVLLRIDSAMARQPGYDGVLPVIHDQIAFLACIERATASRELKELSRAGLIELGYRSICVLPELYGVYGAMIEATLPFYDDIEGGSVPPAA